MSTYWTVVYRPAGMKVWTPWYGNEDEETMRWLHKRETAEAAAKELAGLGYTRPIMHPPSVVPIEFRAAKVEVEV
jgi:hypothetical protein